MLWKEKRKLVTLRLRIQKYPANGILNDEHKPIKERSSVLVNKKIIKTKTENQILSNQGKENNVKLSENQIESIKKKTERGKKQ